MTFLVVVGKAAFEALTGRMFFAFLSFGMLGDPVAVSHAGGIIGGLTALLLVQASRCRTGSAGATRRSDRGSA